MRAFSNKLEQALTLLFFIPTLGWGVPQATLEPFTPQLDTATLQRGARHFSAHCQNCHSTSLMRYSRLKAIGFSEAAIKEDFLVAGEKTSDPMRVAMPAKDARAWFGAPAPDLSLTARAKSSDAASGAQWLHAFLKGFYRDDTRLTGWNNTVFHKAAMPHPLWAFQEAADFNDAHTQTPQPTPLKTVEPVAKLASQTSSKAEYDKMVDEIVSYMVWMAEPVAEERQRIGLWVIPFLSLTLILTYLLKKNYWKDVN